jgi:hypothetical protein
MDRLAVWGYTTDAAAVAVNIGAGPRRSTSDLRFRVKNTSGQYEARDVTVAIAGADAWMLLLSDDGHTFTASLALGTLGPTALSGALWLRRCVPSTAELRGYAVTLTLTPTAWAQSTPAA